MPRLRATPEDFRVEEIPLYEPSGSGGFLWLWIEKIGRNTDDLAADLAHLLDVAKRDVGYAGRKDRHAVTRQAFTVPAQVESRLKALDELEGARLLRVEKTDHRLRTGQLLGNRFELRIREVGEPVDLQNRFDALVARGMPNRYGAQRFGRDGRNVERGREILTSPRFRGDRRRAWLMVSAVQSAVFNAVLERRPHDELWSGDIALIHATDDWLWIDDPDQELERLKAFRLSPTGPIFGTKTKRPRGEVLKLERQVMADFDLPPAEQLTPPKGIKIYGDRRALRVKPENADLRYLQAQQMVELDFDLAAGSYATVLVEELFGSFDEGPSPSPAVDAP